MLEMREDADRRHRHWQNVLATVQRDLTEAEMNFAGQVGKTKRVNFPGSILSFNLALVPLYLRTRRKARHAPV